MRLGLPQVALGAGACQHHADGPRHDLEIEPDAPVLDVGDIQRDIAVERGILARLHLPQAGDARQSLEAAQVAQLVLPHFAGQRRTRTDDAHVAAQNIEELRQLIQRILAQESAQPGDARVVGDLEQHAVALVHVHHVGAPLLRVAHHGAELDAAKDAALLADALRGVEDRAAANPA